MIRPYREIDLETLAHIWLEASLISHDFIPASYWQSHLPAMREKYIPQSETYVWVDEQSHQVCGFISLIDDYLAALFVDPRHQHNGIGRALTRYVQDKRTSLNVHVYAANKPAILFYEQVDFIIRQEQWDENTGHQEFVMCWERSL